jgi:hypothetical protein
MSLSVLASKIKESEHRANSTANPHVYARGVPGEDSTLMDSLNAREERRRKLGGASHSQEDHRSSTEPSNSEQWDRKVHPDTDIDRVHSLGREHGFTAIPSVLVQPSDMNDQSLLTDTPSSTQMNFQDTQPTNFEGISNFDLNMVDLFEGANLDSLFDMLGQQFPSF